jgi:quinol monooxygenase YgiN
MTRWSGGLALPRGGAILRSMTPGLPHSVIPPMPRVILHLRIRILPGRRDALLAFLREAIPFYERPGGIRVSLYEDAADADRFIEVVEYADRAAFDADQRRVENDPEMRAWLERWRELLQGPPEVEVYRDISPLVLSQG